MKFIIFMLAFVSTAAFADSIGNFDQIQNEPGRITSEKKDNHYKGVVFKNADGDDKDGIDRRSPSKIILESYVNKDGTVNVSALQALYLKARNEDNAAFQVVCQKEKKVAGAAYCSRGLAAFQKDESEDAKKVLKKFNEEELTMGRAFAYAEVKRAIELGKNLAPLIGETNLNTKEAYAFYEALFNALDVFDSTKPEDYVFGNMYKHLATVKNIITPLIINSKVEASNLVNPANGEYASSEFLNKMGAAASELDPKDSGFWRRPTKPISSFNTANYDGKVQIDESMLDPKAPVSVEFSKVKPGGVTPKMDVKIGKEVFKLKFPVAAPAPADAGTGVDALKNYSLRTGETQTETVVNNLAAALGFTVDPTFYKEDVRLFVNDGFKPDGDRETYELRFQKALKEVVAALEEGDSAKPLGAKYNYQAALSDIRTVETGEQAGRRYVAFNGGSLERRSDGDNEIKLEGFHKSLNGKDLKREIRGFQMFYAWIADKDAKDSNSDVRMRKVKLADGTETYKLVFSASDMGASLGWLFGNLQPNIFSGDLVNFEKTDLEKGVLSLKMPIYARYDIWNAVTVNDARWAIRLIAQLTPDQIRQAFKASNVPDYAAEVFVQKLLKRRDQLLTATGLMGTTVRAHGTGELVKLETESQLKDGVVFKAPGYEECFDKVGNIIEVPGKCSKRWADTFKPIKEGSAEQELLNSMIYGQLPQFVQPFVKMLQRFDYYTPLQRTATDPLADPTGALNGAFFEGVSVGVDSFIPARYIIANPIKDAVGSSESKPWWIVDVFRTGYGLKRATDLDTSFNAAGFSLSPEDSHLGVKMGKTWEFMRIRAVRDPKEFADGIVKVLAPKNMFVTAMKNLSEKMVEGMQDGDVFISSTYLSAGATMKFFPVMTATTLITPEIKIGASHAVTNRITMVKEPGSKVLVNWQDLNKTDLGGNVSLKLFMINLGGLRERITRLSQMDRTFDFDIANADQKALLFKNMKRNLPKLDDKKEQALLTSLAVSDKDQKQKEHLRSFGFLGLPTFLDYKRSQEVIIRDPQNHEEIEEAFLALKKGKKVSGVMFFQANILNSNEISSEAVADKAGNIFAKFKVDYSRSWAKRDHYKKDVAEKLLPLLPEGVATFDPGSVGYYLGTLEVKGQILYSNDALKDVLSQNLTQNAVCAKFVAGFAASVPEVKDLCSTSFDNVEPFAFAERNGRTAEDKSRIRSALMATRAFTENFMSAQKAFAAKGTTTLTSDGKSKVQKAMQKVVSLLETRPLRNYVLNTLQSMTTDAKIYRMASISSSMGGLPNYEDEVKLNKVDRGGHKLTQVEASDSILSYTDTQVDAVHDAVRTFFFDFLFKEGIAAQGTPQAKVPGELR